MATTFDEETIIILEFGHVRNSPDYSRAVALAESLSTYSKEGQGSQLRHRVTLTADEGRQWLELYSIVHQWKSASINRGKLSFPARGDVGPFMCYLARCKAIDKDAHCFRSNWIGCYFAVQGRTLRVVDRSGVFLDKRRFQTDKEAIRDRVANSPNKYHFCPAFSPARINQQIDKLPPIIELTNNPDWEAVVEQDDSGQLRLVELSYRREADSNETLEIEDVDGLDKFRLQHALSFSSADENIWEHKIVVLSRGDWLESARSGSVPEIAELGKQGWQLVSVVPFNEEWFCVFQRLASQSF